MKKYSVVVLLAFIWAAYYYSLGISNKLIDPFATGVFIRLLTFLILTMVMGAKGRLKALRVSQALLPRLVLIGCMGFLLDITAFLGSRYGNAATGSILLKTDVLMVGAISAVLYRQRFSGKEWGLVAVMLAGVALVLGIEPAHLSLQWADLFYLLSAFFVSVNAFIIKSVQKDHCPNDVIAYYNNAVTLVFFLGASLVTGALGDLAAIASPPLLTALLVGGFGQFFVYVFYYQALERLPVWNVKIILLLIPVITLFYDFIVAGALPTPGKLAGMVIVLSSAVAVIRLQSAGQKISSALSK